MRSEQLPRPIGFAVRTLLCLTVVVVSCHDCLADEATDTFNKLFDIISVRRDLDGSTVIPEAEAPLLWKNSTFLVEDRNCIKLLGALKSFDKLPQTQIELLSSLQRAILQHHLWSVFDWTTIAADPHPIEQFDAMVTRVPTDVHFRLQMSLASAIKKLALSQTEILALPSPVEATVNSEVYPQLYDSSDAFKPFLPVDVCDPNGEWVCISKPDFPVPAIHHAEAVDYRSVFLIFLRLPDGRQQTIDYLAELNAFRKPWLTEKPKRFVGMPTHHELRDLELYPNPDTPSFPVGTQVALVKQALLIDDSGAMVLSPLVQTIQLRAYLNVSQEISKNNPSIGPRQALAEFVLQPRLMMQSKTPMRAVASNEIRHTNTFVYADPIEMPRANAGSHAPRLRTCMTCHSGPGIHSINSYKQFFQAATILPPRLKATTPTTAGTGAIREKRKAYSWGLLRGLWRAF